MSNILSAHLVRAEKDFILGRNIDKDDLLALLNFHADIDMDDARHTYYGNMVDSFWEHFTLVEESEVDRSLDNYWRVYKHLPSNTYFKQSSYYSSYDYEPRFDNAYWNIVQPLQVRVTQYMDIY